MDEFDRRILVELQQNAGRSVDALADVVGLSRNAVWRRVRQLEETGFLKGRVALVDPDAVGLGLIVFISIKTDRHDAEWSAAFAKAAADFEEILGVYRTSGEQTT